MEIQYHEQEPAEIIEVTDTQTLPVLDSSDIVYIKILCVKK